MATGCKFCLLPGEQGVSFAKGNIFDNDEDFFEHIEMEHDIPVRRDDETQEQAFARVKAKNPRMGGPDCRCPGCKKQGNALALMEALRPR